ncbi:hypothetical protein DFP72DRAFT_1116509 [Ephemerocybe angulata]|uniref:Uncharacterized protein n=1 Tax=Ephemerocybe angulata TaxID=980116 RepID=A0A8H6I092_9AGAR|nr:hypothetical protein DFP72DRAFT_1116509 [Tulosesus angulatus]
MPPSPPPPIPPPSGPHPHAPGSANVHVPHRDCTCAQSSAPSSRHPSPPPSPSPGSAHDRSASRLQHWISEQCHLAVADLGLELEPLFSAATYVPAAQRPISTSAAAREDGAPGSSSEPGQEHDAVMPLHGSTSAEREEGAMSRGRRRGLSILTTSASRPSPFATSTTTATTTAPPTSGSGSAHTTTAIPDTLDADNSNTLTLPARPSHTNAQAQTPFTAHTLADSWYWRTSSSGSGSPLLAPDIQHAQHAQQHTSIRSQPSLGHLPDTGAEEVDGEDDDEARSDSPLLGFGSDSEEEQDSPQVPTPQDAPLPAPSHLSTKTSVEQLHHHQNLQVRVLHRRSKSSGLESDLGVQDFPRTPGLEDMDSAFLVRGLSPGGSPVEGGEDHLNLNLGLDEEQKTKLVRSPTRDKLRYPARGYKRDLPSGLEEGMGFTPDSKRYTTCSIHSPSPSPSKKAYSHTHTHSMSRSTTGSASHSQSHSRTHSAVSLGEGREETVTPTPLAGTSTAASTTTTASTTTNATATTPSPRAPLLQNLQNARPTPSPPRAAYYTHAPHASYSSTTSTSASSSSVRLSIPNNSSSSLGISTSPSASSASLFPGSMYASHSSLSSVQSLGGGLVGVGVGVGGGIGGGGGSPTLSRKPSMARMPSFPVLREVKEEVDLEGEGEGEGEKAHVHEHEHERNGSGASTYETAVDVFGPVSTSSPTSTSSSGLASAAASTPSTASSTKTVTAIPYPSSVTAAAAAAAAPPPTSRARSQSASVVPRAPPPSASSSVQHLAPWGHGHSQSYSFSGSRSASPSRLPYVAVGGGTPPVPVLPLSPGGTLGGMGLGAPSRASVGMGLGPGVGVRTQTRSRSGSVLSLSGRTPPSGYPATSHQSGYYNYSSSSYGMTPPPSAALVLPMTPPGTAGGGVYGGTGGTGGTPARHAVYIVDGEEVSRRLGELLMGGEGDEPEFEGQEESEEFRIREREREMGDPVLPLGDYFSRWPERGVSRDVGREEVPHEGEMEMGRPATPPGQRGVNGHGHARSLSASTLVSPPAIGGVNVNVTPTRRAPYPRRRGSGLDVGYGYGGEEGEGGLRGSTVGDAGHERGVSMEYVHGRGGSASTSTSGSGSIEKERERERGPSLLVPTAPNTPSFGAGLYASPYASSSQIYLGPGGDGVHSRGGSGGSGASASSAERPARLRRGSGSSPAVLGGASGSGGGEVGGGGGGDGLLLLPSAPILTKADLEARLGPPPKRPPPAPPLDLHLGLGLGGEFAGVGPGSAVGMGGFRFPAVPGMLSAPVDLGGREFFEEEEVGDDQDEGEGVGYGLGGGSARSSGEFGLRADSEEHEDEIEAVKREMMGFAVFQEEMGGRGGEEEDTLKGRGGQQQRSRFATPVAPPEVVAARAARPGLQVVVPAGSFGGEYVEEEGEGQGEAEDYGVPVYSEREKSRWSVASSVILKDVEGEAAAPARPSLGRASVSAPLVGRAAGAGTPSTFKSGAEAKEAIFFDDNVLAAVVGFSAAGMAGGPRARKRRSRDEWVEREKERKKEREREKEREKAKAKSSRSAPASPVLGRREKEKRKSAVASVGRGGSEDAMHLQGQGQQQGQGKRSRLASFFSKISGRDAVSPPPSTRSGLVAASSSSRSSSSNGGHGSPAARPSMNVNVHTALSEPDLRRVDGVWEALGSEREKEGEVIPPVPPVPPLHTLPRMTSMSSLQSGYGSPGGVSMMGSVVSASQGPGQRRRSRGVTISSQAGCGLEESRWEESVPPTPSSFVSGFSVNASASPSAVPSRRESRASSVVSPAIVGVLRTSRSVSNLGSAPVTPAEGEWRGSVVGPAGGSRGNRVSTGTTGTGSTGPPPPVPPKDYGAGAAYEWPAHAPSPVGRAYGSSAASSPGGAPGVGAMPLVKEEKARDRMMVRLRLKSSPSLGNLNGAGAGTGGAGGGSKLRSLAARMMGREDV